MYLSYPRQNGKPLIHDNYVDEGDKLYGCCDCCGRPMYKPPLISKLEFKIYHHLSECGRYCSDTCAIAGYINAMENELKGLLNEKA